MKVVIISLPISLLLFLLTVSPSYNKILTRCKLTGELIKNGYPRTFISNWVCLADHESERNTSKITKKTDGTYNLGIFQINSKKWCKMGNRKGGLCNVTCDSFLDDNMSDDTMCANKIFESEGFKAWQAWVKKCKGNRLPDISRCPDFLEASQSDTVKTRRSSLVRSPLFQHTYGKPYHMND